MSTLPNWNPSQQRQDYQNSSYAVPMSADHGVTELTWENGQLGMHGVNKSATTATITTTAYGGDTLESIVHQATYHQKYGLMNMEPENQKNHEQPNISNNTATPPPPMEKQQAGQVQMLIPPYTGVVKKRGRMELESDQCGRYLSNGSRMLHDLGEERSGCASAGATFCRDNFNKDATFVTWGSSFDSPPSQSFKIKTTDFDDSASHGGGLANNNDEEQETKGGSLGTCSARRSRAAAVHNQSERRRRDKINQKMKALQKLVPNANKTDKASMLDEVIDYLKQLQTQVDQMMSSRTIVPQTQMMVNTLAMQQQMQMSLLASRMGSMPGFGMFDLNAMVMARVPPHPSLQSGIPINPTASLGSSASPFMPPGIPTPTTTTTNSGNSTHGLNPFNHPYNAFLAQQAGNMDFYSKMAALYRHDQANQARSNPLPNFSQGK